MHTHVTDSPEDAAAYLRRGEVVAFPTETVYGLGADAYAPAAVQKIFEAKGRPSDNPLIVHIAGLDQLEGLVASVPSAAQDLLACFFPGPLTLILPRHPDVSPLVSAGLETIGVRMPAHPVAQAFLAACGRPVAAPSANLSGRPSPTTWEAVRTDLDGRIACLLRGDASDVGLESTVVDCTGAVPVVLRAGGVAVEALRAVVPEVQTGGGAHLLARSPGTRYRHYAPAARVIPVADLGAMVAAPEAAYIGVDTPPDASSYGRCLVCNDVAAYARALFHFFRSCDDAGLARIYCQLIPPEGLGLALTDRITRAAKG